MIGAVLPSWDIDERAVRWFLTALPGLMLIAAMLVAVWPRRREKPVADQLILPNAFRRAGGWGVGAGRSTWKRTLIGFLLFMSLNLVFAVLGTYVSAAIYYGYFWAVVAVLCVALITSIYVQTGPREADRARLFVNCASGALNRWIASQEQRGREHRQRSARRRARLQAWWLRVRLRK